MLDINSSSLATAIACLLVVIVLTLPSVSSIISHFREKDKQNLNNYTDKDGSATEETIAAFSTKLPKSLLIISTLLLEDCFNVVLWSFILIQANSTILSRNPTKAYANGVRAAVSSSFLFALCLYGDGLIVEDKSVQEDFRSSATFWLRLSQLSLALFAAISAISFPRRPHVTHNKHPVDGMLSVSALERYAFSWVGDILALASHKTRLELQDLPKMDHYTRAKDLSEAWEEREHTKALWIEIFLTHKSPFIIQWILTVFQAFGNFAPQFVTFQILKILERRKPGDEVPFEAWIWVATLFLVTLAAAWIESWMFWISWSELAIPIRSQLSAQIFQKAMRRKDVKGAARTGKKSTSTTSDAAQESIAPGTPEDEEEDADPKGKQSTVNLIVAGMLAMSLTIPLNIYFSKRYSAAQDRLMKIRDVKMAVVTEALQGIRQIKFSALEKNWGDKIGLVRKKELDEQWSVYLNDTMLLFCWITSPIALAAVALAVYAYIHGVLLPSVAFTAIGVFVNLEVTLSVIPELTTDLIDAYISVKRIERYLGGAEISESTSDAPNVSFEKASIAWPCAEGEDEMDGNERYVLRNVDVSFPKGELSIISGKTGTGKIHVPRGPKAADRHDHLANKDNWIIPSSIAFVAQIPWIENASIKDNILFGLPFDEDRYKKVIEYCALRKDLEMLGDGENTEIGANGINLSGGQRWRVTFARALYSRAGILVLDDIFSAVDAHVGRFIYEKGLTGELGDGTVESAGFLSDLKEAGTLEHIISHEETPEQIAEDESPILIVSRKDDAKKFVEEETRERGSVKGKVYGHYLNASGGWSFWTLVLIAFLGQQFLVTGRSWWVETLDIKL
ncbi:hypothetical protein DID88_002564 [Monilinia fructigena]|uniref:ABC transmembrane type-1 domain-containing protein n=1 Tax=Monilinia fructigena TaxID=38457 RepID=A0A395IR55_9HELO|nr:hypothetical protein DID88_002564 [Monilinia fructigena]